MVEPRMVTPEIPARTEKAGAVLARAADAARMRKDTWPSRAAARERIATRLPWRRWDPLALDLSMGCATSPRRGTPTSRALHWLRRARRRRECIAITKTRSRLCGGWRRYAPSCAYTALFGAISDVVGVHPALLVCELHDIETDFRPAEVQAAIVDVTAGRLMRSIVRVRVISSCRRARAALRLRFG
ncbi:hypothetical protein BD413DRAFT_572397 [Trametes elegans]|nr:hypothetical protein BD413DRAFT_572397 [Trametes elegans]